MAQHQTGASKPFSLNQTGTQSRRHPAHFVSAIYIIKRNVTVDWVHKDSTRAKIRVHVKRLLRIYGYPPDLQDAAVQNVLAQAEALSAEWAA